MSTKLKVGNNYLIEVRLIDPWTNEQYIHECLAEVIDWFSNGVHFYFDDGYGLERFVKVNSERVIAFEGKEVVVAKGEVASRFVCNKAGRF